MINLIFTLLVLAFLLFGFLWGFIRGIKKSAFRGAWLLLTLILCLIFTPLISNAVGSINISSFDIVIDGQQASTIYSAIQLTLESSLKSIGLENLPLIENISKTLPIVLLNPFVFVILFWLLKIVLLPINAIVANIIFNKKPKTQKQNLDAGGELLQKKQQKQKIKKHRLLGGAVGVAVGLLVCCATFVPVFGLIDIANELNSTTVTIEANGQNPDSNSIIITSSEENQNDTKTVSLLELMIGDNVKYIDEVNSSVGYNFLKYTGIKSLSSIQFDNLTTATVDGTTIHLSSDIKQISSLSNDLIAISNFDNQNITKESISSFITATQSLLTKSKDISLFNLISQQDISYICDTILDENNSNITLPDTGYEFTNQLLVTMIQNFSNYNFNHILDDIINVTNIIKTANDNDLLIPILNNELQTNQQVLDYIASIPDEFYDTTIDNIFNIDIISSCLPMSAEYGLSELYKYYEVPYDDISINANILKEYAKTMLKDASNVVKNIDINTKYYVNKDSIIYIGKLLTDATKQYTIENESQYIIPAENVKIILDKMEDNIIDYMKDVNQKFIDTLTPIIRNISNITDYQTEFNKYATAFDLLKPYIDVLTQNFDYENIQNFDLTNVGKSIDLLNDTVLINNKFYTIYNFILDYGVKDSTIDGVSLSSLAVDLSLNDDNNVNYETELAKLTPLYQEIIKILKDTNIDDLLSSAEIKTIGNNLQEIKTKNQSQSTTPLFDVDTLVVDILDVLSQTNIDGNIKQVIIDTKTEIENTVDKSTIDYSVEFTHIYNAIQLLNNSSTNTINDYLAVADEIANGSSQVKASTILTRPIYNLISKNIPNASDYTETFIQTIINTLKTNIENKSQLVNAKNEINCFIKLFNQIDNIQDLNENNANFSTTLAEISSTIEYIDTNSILLTNLKSETINQLFKIVKDNITDNNLSTALDSARQDALTTNETLSQIYQDIVSIKDQFSNIDYTIDDFNSTNTLSIINNKLKSIVATNSFTHITSNAIYTIILNSVKSDLISKIDNTDISSLPQEKQDEIQNYKQQFIDLIDLEKTNLNNITDSNVNNNYYLNSLNRIKTQIDNNPIEQ